MEAYTYFSLVSPSSAETNAPLHEGDTVFIRIIAQTASQTYTAAFSGGRFPVTSNVPLEIGSSFLAKISLAGEKIVLSPVKSVAENFDTKNILSQLANTENTGALSPEISAYFNSLGLVADEVTMRLFWQMKTLGMKFDRAILQKAWRIARQFTGKEDEAADAALALEKKGISASAQNVAALLGGFAFSTGDSENGKSPEKRHDSGSSEDVADGVISAESLKKFFMGLFGVFGDESAAAFDGVTASEPANEFAGDRNYGVLSLFNTMDSSNGANNSNWITLPFNFSVSGENGDDDNGQGSLRIFSDEKQKKIALNVFFNSKNYYFVIYYKLGKCEKIEAGVLPEITQAEKKQFEKDLESLVGFDVELVDAKSLCGFCPDETPISIVRGSV